MNGVAMGFVSIISAGKYRTGRGAIASPVARFGTLLGILLAVQIFSVVVPQVPESEVIHQGITEMTGRHGKSGIREFEAHSYYNQIGEIMNGTHRTAAIPPQSSMQS